MFVHAPARVYSCRQQSDAALISNYDVAGREEAVNFTRPAVRNKVIPLSAANEIFLLFSEAESNHLNNKTNRSE